MPFKDYVDQNAQHYHNNSEQQYDRAHELIAPELFDESDKVLDVGCGEGRITAEIVGWLLAV